MSFRSKFFFLFIFLIFLAGCSAKEQAKRLDVPSKIITTEAVVDIKGNNGYGIGNPSAPVKIMEFSDYQCPFCKQFHDSAFPKIKQEYIDTGKAYYILKEFPLEMLHKNAFDASMSAVCSGKQGKYFEMQDLLFEKQEEWSNENSIIKVFEDYADKIKLDVDSFIACMNSPKTEKEIKESIKLGDSLGLTGTPSFVINGKVIKGASSFSSFKEYLDNILQEMGVDDI